MGYMITLRTSLLVSICGLVFAACVSGDDGGGDAPPAAPSDLTVVPREGAAHVTWKDNSSNEAHFMVTRKAQGAAGDYATIATVPVNTAVYHDAAVTRGTAYTYRIVAMNDAGDASESNEVTFTVP
jgi:hypothetical protein